MARPHLRSRWQGYLLLRRIPPLALLALMYAGLIALGTGALRLPLSHHGELGWMTAFFTSTSAVTVTGLTEVDIGSTFTGFGQGVIALLIQMGGLGLMTFAALVLSTFGIPIGMPQRMILRADLNQTSLSNLGVLAVSVFKITVLVELIGITLLAFVFVPDFGLWPGLWQAVFHGISAFNNAGFSLFADNLSGYVTNPIINLVIPAMFIIGGIGFIVIGDLVQVRNWHRLSLHSKLMLAGTGVLIVWGALTFGVLEWHNPATLGAIESPWGRALAAWFQGVSPRTAGFNTIDTAAIHDQTALLTMTLMMIGGGSTSTAGGIKVTTFIVLILATFAFFRRHDTLHIFGRSIGTEEVIKVLALAMVSVLLVMGALFVLMTFEDSDFLLLAFEVVSAFGTVGLSLGATGHLDTLGQLVIIFVMFVGRVGPLTLGFFLATRSLPRVRYPDGRVYLG